MIRSALQQASRKTTVKSTSGALRFMGGKEIKFGVEGRAAMMRGVDVLADAVQVSHPDEVWISETVLQDFSVVSHLGGTYQKWTKSSFRCTSIEKFHEVLTFFTLILDRSLLDPKAAM
jgi:hypothetical protein